MNKIKVGVFLLALAGAWVGNLWYYGSQKLENPLFLKIYYEIEAGQLQYLQFYYIANKGSTQVPYRIILPDNTGLQVVHDTIRDQSGRLVLHEVTVTGENQANLIKSSTVTFDQFTVYYKNGMINTVPIGSLIIHPMPTAASSTTSPLQMQSSTSSSDGKGYASYKITRDVTFQSLRYSFSEYLEDAVKVELNGNPTDQTSLLRLALKKDDGLRLSYQFQLPDQDIRRYNAYQLRIAYQEAGGDSFLGMHSFQIQPELYKRDLAKYVRLRKGDTT